jgi:mgtE-like transporter
MGEGFFDTNFREILSSQTISVLVGLVAGTAIAAFTDKLLLIPGMLILLPGFLEMRGNISGSCASRLSAGLFVGMIRPDREITRVTRGNMAASFLLSLVTSAVLGAIAALFIYIVTGALALQIVLISVVAGVIANVIEIPLTVYFTFYFFRKGHDPNNIMGPFITSVGDVTSVASLLIAMVFI